jgi:hypothetical protein
LGAVAGWRGADRMEDEAQSMSDVYPTSEEVPTDQLRWRYKRSVNGPLVLQQLWKCRYLEKSWTQWRDVPVTFEPLTDEPKAL